MNKDMFLRSLGIVALAMTCSGVANATSVIDRLPSCEGASWSDTCRISVPNETLGGFPGDERWHEPSWGGAWEPESPRHSVAQHIAPWIYIDGSRGRHQQTAADEVFTLARQRDGISQTIRLPTQETPAMHDVVYAVRARIDATKGEASVSLDLSLLKRGAAVGSSQSSVVLSRPARGGAGAGLIGWIVVPAGDDVDALNVKLAVTTASAPVTVTEVSVVRMDEAVAAQWARQDW